MAPIEKRRVKVQISVRIFEDQLEHLDALCRRAGNTTRNAVVRAALDEGLPILEKEYPPSGSTPAKSRKA